MGVMHVNGFNKEPITRLIQMEGIVEEVCVSSSVEELVLDSLELKRVEKPIEEEMVSEGRKLDGMTSLTSLSGLTSLTGLTEGETDEDLVRATLAVKFSIARNQGISEEELVKATIAMEERCNDRLTKQVSGFDFHGVGKEVLEAMVRREAEDEERFKAMGGHVALTIENFQKSFFWGDGVEQRKLHAVDWKTMCGSKSNRGLGIGRIVDKNNGMLAKWVWRYGKDKDLLWRKAVSSLFKERSQSRRIMDEGLKIVVGNGESVNFWSDVWCDNLALKDRFPRIFALAVKKVGVINTFGGWLEDRWIWEVQLRRRVFDWEREAYKSDLEDCNAVWNGFSPPKVELFLWQLLKDRLLVWVTLFSAIAWSIWEARNQVMFKGNPVDITYYVDLVRFMVAWWFKHYGKGSSEQISIILENLKTCYAEVKKVRTSGNKVWVPPKEEDLSFNVDGSVRRIFWKAEIGGFLRNSKGKILCSFSAPVSSLDVNMVELMAIHKACVICVSNPVFVGKKITISSDSRTAVSWVIDNDFCNLCLWDLIADIRSMLLHLSNTTVKHCSRDLNDMTDRLAKQGAALNGELIVWGV
ncbi:hypothetical protein Ddye_007494 [Dipteronia dyeriana]|uniref:RNase H type-1 domain-containing protein n=1 Tax=Dipteronia dyeriana TaxID=168575 RepID=A0AAD9XJY3_9ROSI|nr:hypothetical protein Ddye_007494 [Dipteronia dyeriana]